MKSMRIVFAAAILAIIAAQASAQAQTYPFNIPGVENLPAGNEFQQFLTNHPKVAGQLSANPNLAYNPQWRANHPQLNGFIQNHPQFWQGYRGMGSNYYQSEFQNYLNNHPKLANEIRSNPELLYNQQYIRNHPELNQYLSRHPNVWRAAKSQAAMGAPNGMMPSGGGPDGDGDYDQNHQWHNANWWRDNNPQAWRQNHPQWAANHPHWYNDGDYDQHNQWHNPGWWQKHNPDAWRHFHHPGHAPAYAGYHGHGPGYGAYGPGYGGPEGEHEGWNKHDEHWQKWAEKHGHPHGGHGDHDGD